MNKKYEFTDETKILIDGTALHRIRSIIQIKTPHTIIKPGTLGGWIENEINLSHVGNAWVFGDAWVYGDADISKTEHYINVGPIGSRNDYTTFYKDKFNNIQVKCGCFTGSIDEFLKKVDETHKDSKHRLIYRSAASLAMLQINLA